MNVKIVRLVTGEDIMGEVTDSSATMPISIKDPVRVVVLPNKLDPKTPQVGFAPWAEFSDDKSFSIDKSKIVCIMTPIKEFVQQYKTMFGGIIPAPQSKLIVPGA
jgi:hypothetical protein